MSFDRIRKMVGNLLGNDRGKLIIIRNYKSAEVVTEIN